MGNIKLVKELYNHYAKRSAENQCILKGHTVIGKKKGKILYHMYNVKFQLLSTYQDVLL